MPPQQNPEGYVFLPAWSTLWAFCKEKVVLFAVLGRPTSRSLNVVEPSTTNTSMCECTWTASEYLRRLSDLRCYGNLSWSAQLDLDDWYILINDIWWWMISMLTCSVTETMCLWQIISIPYYERGPQALKWSKMSTSGHVLRKPSWRKTRNDSLAEAQKPLEARVKQFLAHLFERNSAARCCGDMQRLENMVGISWPKVTWSNKSMEMAEIGHWIYSVKSQAFWTIGSLRAAHHGEGNKPHG